MRRRPLKYRMEDTKRRASGFRTICEVQRQMHRLVAKRIEPKDPETAKYLFALLAEGYDLGKRMDRALREYKGTWPQDILEPMQGGDVHLPDEVVVQDGLADAHQ